MTGCAVVAKVAGAVVAVVAGPMPDPVLVVTGCAVAAGAADVGKFAARRIPDAAAEPVAPDVLALRGHSRS